MTLTSKMQNLHIRHPCHQPRRSYLSYGDVVGDSRWLRSLIATQLLICVLVMACFVSSVDPDLDGGMPRRRLAPLQTANSYGSVSPKKRPQQSAVFYLNGGPPRSRTGHQRIMHTTSAFAAPFGFVVWTVSCLYGSPVQSLHLP